MARRRRTPSTGAGILLAGLVVVFGLLPACGGPEGERPENVILISIDTLRPDHLGCYGYERPTSPLLDRIAEEGVLFADASSTSPWTLPAHASLLTGMYPSRNGVKDVVHRLPQDVPTLAAVLSDAGFDTLAVVNSVNVDQRYGLGRGFDRFELVDEFGFDAQGERRIVNHGHLVIEQALKWLEGRSAERPFFLFVHFYDVHTDFSPKPEYRDLFVQSYDGPIDGTTTQLLQLRSAGARLSKADLQHLHDLYDAEIRQLDDQLAGMFERLDQAGFGKSTLR